MTAQLNRLQIPVTLVRELIAEQFPQWSHLPISPVPVGGWDNRTFRLGKEMSIRLPSAEEYAEKVHIEQQWLPFLARYMSSPIPIPIAIGQPSKNYPWHWSIYRWLKGESANMLQQFDATDLKQLAIDLAKFLRELHKINTTGAPVPGPHNFYRGAAPIVYDEETRSAINQLQHLIDGAAVTEVWERAINSRWDKKPVWIHGDLSAGNILINDNKLCGIIDWGGMAVGDPACDLVIAWTLLTPPSRKIFKVDVNLDTETWARARGWALWKALITIVAEENKTGLKVAKQLNIINAILREHEYEISQIQTKQIVAR